MSLILGSVGKYFSTWDSSGSQPTSDDTWQHLKGKHLFLDGIAIIPLQHHEI